MKILSYLNPGKLWNSRFWNFGFSFILCVIGLILIWLNQNKLPLSVPFWYSKDWGEGMLAAPSTLWLLPLLNLFFIITNFFISTRLEKRNEVLSKLIVWSTLSFSTILFISLIQIVLVST